MRRLSSRVRNGFCVVMLACACATTALATTAPVLDIYGASLTANPPLSSTGWMCPRFDQRGVDIDGTLRLPVPLGWAVAGDPLGGGYSAGRTLGDVNLCTGSYHPTEIDLALPTLGLPVVIGRTYSNLQQNGSGTRANRNAVQGWNWAQTAQPEISLVAGATADLDVLYLHYGADRFIEFKRTGSTSNEFKAKNGAAGVVQFTAGDEVNIPELYTYFDQRGDQIVFFGFNGPSSPASGQVWKMIDPAGNTAYVYDSSNAYTAAQSGYNGYAQVTKWYDASGRRYTFSYTYVTLGWRLTKVEAHIQNAGSWTGAILVGQVDYAYYATTDSGKGATEDLKLVTVTMKGVSGGDYVRSKYYRYYTGTTWADADGSRGKIHCLKMVVGFDGVRQDANYATDSDATLKPYAEAYFEYVSGTDYRLRDVTFNGNCGCAGGNSGTFNFTYAQASSYATDIADTTYQNVWEQRTVVAEPDGTYITQYFDETGAVFGRVTTNADPSASPSKKWITDVQRNSSGQVTAIHAPENITGYTHSTGAITYSTSAGLVTVYARHAASDNLDGLRDSVSVKQGTSGTAGLVSSLTITDVQLTVGASGVSVPTVTHTKTYPDGGTMGLDTVLATTYWSTTATNVGFIAPKTITVTNPTASTGNNGSGSATTTVRYLRQDGSTAFTKDAGAILYYSGQSAYGQTATTIADCNTATTGDYLSGDAPSTWSVTTSGTAIHAKSTMTYDDQGRPLTRVQPGVNGNRTLAWSYTLDSARLGTFSYPRYASSTYYGPVGYTRVNHAGRPDRRATIDLGSGGSGSAPSTTPGSTTWSAMVDTIYDQSGMRATDTYTYTDTTNHDTASVGYNSMGRLARTIDVTGTIGRTVYDERGMVVERWVGTNDHSFSDPAGSSGTDNMVKVEAMEYDNAASGGGGNGYLTKRTQDADGNWTGTSDQRATTYAYDYRGRMGLQTNPVSPHTLVKYDNSNRAIATGQYNAVPGLTVATDPTSTASSGGTIRLTLSETAYDERGQVFQSTRWEITQSSGVKGSSQVTDNWYDASGRLAKSMGSQITKTIYDRLGRAQDRFVIAKVDDTTYAHALDVAGDTVLEQSHSALDPTTGAALAQWQVQRAHDDASTGTAGALDTNADNDTLKLTATNLTANARAQITAMWYDNWDRVSDTVAYGTNGGSDFTRSGLSVPSSVVNTPKTSYAFDGFGRVKDVTDPAGKISHTDYDFAGRKSKTTDDYVDGTPGGGTYNDQDRVTEYAYVTGQVTSVKRKMTSSTDDQETTYTYDTTGGGGGSVVKVKNLLTTVVYPPQYATGSPPVDQAASARTVTYVYNALSQVSTTTDPAGNVITTTYDVGGRVTAREATTVATGFDSTVIRIETSYESRGMVGGVQQKNGSTVRDEVAFVYDGWGNMKTFTQDPDSSITGGSGRASYAMTWTYALNAQTGCNRSLYLSSWTQPDGTSGGLSLGVTYATGLDNYVRRVSNTYDDKTVYLAEYKYLGANTAVSMDYVEPKSGTGTWLYGTSGSSTYDTYMDRFNRPIAVKWSPGNGNAAKFIDLGFDYDVRGSAIAVTDAVLRDASTTPKQTFGMLITYDDLRRLAVREEGELNTGHTAIATRSHIENTNRNLAGRITGDQVSLDGNTTYRDGPLKEYQAGEMDDTRTYNKRNELTARSFYSFDHPTTGSPGTATLTYDLNGNLTDDGETYTYKYNAFGQLVSIKNRVTPFDVQAVYTYNGLGQRISEQLDCNRVANDGYGDSKVDSNDPVFFMAVDPQGRRVATYKSTDTYPKETFLYHPGGVRGPSFTGGVQLRDRNSSLSNPTKWATETAGATRAERFYYCTDPSGNVACLVDSSGNIQEQYRYGPSGVPYGIPKGNVKSDGTVNAATSGTTDYTIVNAMIGGAYQVRGDLNLDGVIDSSDTAIITAASGLSLGRGVLSVGAVHNTKESGCFEVFGSGNSAILEGNALARDLALDSSLGGVAQAGGPLAISAPCDGLGSCSPPGWRQVPCVCAATKLYPGACDACCEANAALNGNDAAWVIACKASCTALVPYPNPTLPGNLPVCGTCSPSCGPGTTRWGQTLCQGGQKCVCICPGNLPWPISLQPGDVIECTQVHEGSHYDDGTCMSGTFCQTKGRIAGECEAYQTELNCLRSKLASCQQNQQANALCGMVLSVAIGAAERERDKYCYACSNPSSPACGEADNGYCTSNGRRPTTLPARPGGTN